MSKSPVIELVKSYILFEDINRAVKLIIQRETGYVANDYTFDELDYEYVDTDDEIKTKLVYKIDYSVYFGDGKYENYWGRVEEREVIQFLREEKLNEILK